MVTKALVRGIPETFPNATAGSPPDEPIDVALARRQHAAYVGALRDLGLTVSELPPDEGHPDCCFVEDCAVVVRRRALVTRLGHASRRGEEVAVASALARQLWVEWMEVPATLDGGDCLLAGDRLYVGRSARTNEAGIERLDEVCRARGVTVVPIAVPPQHLHLKCICSPIDDGRILLAEGAGVDASAFTGVRCVLVPPEEAYAANAVVVAGTALVAAGHPRTRAALEAEGLRVVELETTELRKADGSLTCLSIRY